MAVRGAKPSPVSLRVIKGGSIPANVPQPAPEQLPEPDWAAMLGDGNDEALRVNADASVEWQRVVPRLDDLGLLSGLDRTVVVDYCLCWARLQQCEREISSGGMSTDNRQYTSKNPAITAANQYRTALARYIPELGLSPSSRMRLALPGDDDDNELNLD